MDVWIRFLQNMTKILIPVMTRTHAHVHTHTTVECSPFVTMYPTSPGGIQTHVPFMSIYTSQQGWAKVPTNSKGEHFKTLHFHNRHVGYGVLCVLVTLSSTGKGGSTDKLFHNHSSALQDTTPVQKSPLNAHVFSVFMHPEKAPHGWLNNIWVRGIHKTWQSFSIK